MINMNDMVKDIAGMFADRKVCFTRSDVPSNVVLPESWEGFGLDLDKAPKYPEAWQNYSNEFPSVIALLNDSLLGTVLLVGGKLELLYVFHDASGFYYYVGGVPVNISVVEAAEFRVLPGRLQEFYREVHDGYTFFPARSMGPQSLSDLTHVADLIDEEDASFAEGWITVFSNGGGDFVAIDSNASDDSEGLVWWHEEPMAPEFGVDIFEVMDAWMAIFLEDTKTRNELIAKLH